MFRIAFHPIYKHSVPENHRFPMEKYELLPKQLILENIVSPEQFFLPKMASIEEICLVHDAHYVHRYLHLQLTDKEIRLTGFKHCQQLIDRERTLVQGTIDGALYALQDGIAFNIAGGTHHAFTDHGEGFCMLHDQAIAARYLLENNYASKILFVDLDVHQGNGTAEIFHHDDRVFTFSMHGKTNYPFRKETSDCDIALEDGTDDATYLEILEKHLEPLILQTAPDFIFYQAGVDILATDKLGKVCCSIEGCKQRDFLVLNLAKKYNIPIQCSMGGGYSPQLTTILKAHTNTYRIASQLYI